MKSRERKVYAEVGENGLAAYLVKTLAKLFVLETVNGPKAILITCPKNDVAWAAPGRNATPVIVPAQDDGEEFFIDNVGSSFHLHVGESVSFHSIHSVVERHFPGIDHQELHVEFRVCASHCRALLKIRHSNGKSIIA